MRRGRLSARDHLISISSIAKGRSGDDIFKDRFSLSTQLLLPIRKVSLFYSQLMHLVD